MSQVDLIIKKFGGVRAMAGKLPGQKPNQTLSPGAVSHWRKIGYIPNRRVPDILAAAEKEGIDLDATDFVPSAAA